MRASDGHPGTGPSFFLLIHHLTFLSPHDTLQTHSYSINLPQVNIPITEFTMLSWFLYLQQMEKVKVFPVGDLITNMLLASFLNL